VTGSPCIGVSGIEWVRVVLGGEVGGGGVVVPHGLGAVAGVVVWPAGRGGFVCLALVLAFGVALGLGVPLVEGAPCEFGQVGCVPQFGAGELALRLAGGALWLGVRRLGGGGWFLAGLVEAGDAGAWVPAAQFGGGVLGGGAGLGGGVVPAGALGVDAGEQGFAVFEAVGELLVRLRRGEEFGVAVGAGGAGLGAGQGGLGGVLAPGQRGSAQVGGDIGGCPGEVALVPGAARVQVGVAGRGSTGRA
jgi:hypothetical protein